jgi:hypothetical protein
MSKSFFDSGWEFDGTDQLDAGIDLGPVSATASHGFLHLISDFKENIKYEFHAFGAGLGISPSPIDISGALKDMPSAGLVYANPIFRDYLSVEDFNGSCLIQTYTGSSFPALGGSVSIIFFDVDKGIITSAIATFASGGVLALGAHATIIASCSAMVVSAALVASTPQAGASVLLGRVSLEEGRRGSADLCAYPWKVTINGKDYSYIFHEDGRCYWYEYGNSQISPNGKGKWKVGKDPIEVSWVEISWESGSCESWKLPISLIAQTGIWQTKEKKVFRIKAKFDPAKITLINKTLNYKTSAWSPF